MTRVMHLGAGAIGVSLCAWSGAVAAADFEVNGDVAFQAYEVQSPFGDRALERRRLLTTLGLAGYNLQGDYKPFKPDYSIQLRMRLDADFGVDDEETSFSPGSAGRFIPGYDQPPVDLMYGYVEGRNLIDGLMTVRVGRQYVTDVLGWWSFDGGLVKVVTPFFIGAEVYGGLEQRGGLPLSTSRFESQGIWRGAGGDIEGAREDYPSFQTAAQAPAFGAAIESAGPNWIHGRFDYRRVYNLGEAFTTQFPTAGGGYTQVDGLRLSSERIGWSGAVYVDELGGLKGGVAYDIYNQLVSKIFANLDVYAHEKVTVGAEFDYFNPTFDADSIWNWFTHKPVITMLGRVSVGDFSVGSSGGFEADLSGGARLWMADGDPETWATAQCESMSNDPIIVDRCLRFGIDPSNGQGEIFSRTEENRGNTLAPDLMGNLAARYRWSSGHVGGHAMLQTGFGDENTNRGNRYGGSLYAKQDIVGELFFLGARVSAYRWNDPLREDRDASSFGYVVAPELFPWEYTKLRVEWEHDMNRLVGQRFRLMAYVTFRLDSNLSGGFGSTSGYLGNAL